MPTTTGVATEFINFSRASNATVTDSNGVIKWARHNLLLASEQFDASSWTKNNATVAANAIAAPNGTTTADTMTATGAVAGVVQAYSAISGQLTASVFAKAGTNSSVTIRIAQAGNGYETAFTLTGSGTAGTPAIVGTGGTVTGMTAAITAFSDGWYRCTITYNETNLGNVFIIQGATSGTVSIWGAHLYRSDMGMQANTSAYPMYNPTTPKNLLGFTENFDNAAWGNTALTVTANTTLAPNGLATGDFVVPTTASSTHRLLQGITVGTTTATLSVYTKAAGYNWVYLRINGFNTYFDLSAAAVGTTNGNSGAAITSVGNGWYRISANRAVTAGSINYGFGVASADNTDTFTGDGTSGIYLWGAQLSDSASLDAYTPNHFAAPSAAAYYGPRLDYDPVTLAAKGLLVEEQRTNFFLNSNAPTAGTGITITAGAAVSPDGSTNAYRIAKTDATDPRYFSRSTSMTTVAGRTYTVSAWFKYDGFNTVVSLEYNSTANWDLPWIAQFTVASTGVTVFSVSSCTASVQNVGNGWYRAIVTFTAGAAPTVTSNPSVLTRVTGASGVTVLGYGGQIEENASFATSYIPTTSATVTRNGDVAQVGTAAFPYSATEGTLVVSADTYDVGTTGGLMATLSAGLASNSIIVGVFSNKTTLSSTVGGVAQAFLQPSGTISTNTVFKAGGAFTTNSFIASSNGTLSTEDTSGSVPTGVTTLGVGIISASLPINGHIRQITYLPRRISNAELTARTA